MKAADGGSSCDCGPRTPGQQRSPVYADAIARVRWLQAEASTRGDVNAELGALATATRDGAPSVRTVRIVRIDEAGVVFFADRETGKGRQLRDNPRAAICFHWHMIHHQVVVEGDVTCLADDEADRLWRKVPRRYGLAHWASKQNSDAVDAHALQEQVRTFGQRYSTERVPRPPQWRAFEVRPRRIDIWQTGWRYLRPHIHYIEDPADNWTRSMRSP